MAAASGTMQVVGNSRVSRIAKPTLPLYTMSQPPPFTQPVGQPPYPLRPFVMPSSTVQISSDHLSSIRLWVFDFDGVMTDNRVLVFDDGHEAVFCNRGDGLGLDMMRAAGCQMLILSTERNVVVARRAEKLKLPVLHGSSDKLATLRGYCDEREIDLDRVAFVGNDLNDLSVMRAVGLRLCPADAHPIILDLAHCILDRRGGEGVIRALADALFPSLKGDAS